MITLIAAEKGGTGKSTIAAHLAVLRSAERRVLLIDADPQETASTWFHIRESNGLNCGDLSCEQIDGEVDEQIDQFHDQYDDIIIDVAGRDSMELRSAVLVSDITVIPTQPSGPDLWRADPIANVVKRAQKYNKGLKAFWVLSRCSTRDHNRRAWITQKLITEMGGFPVLKTFIYDRLPYQDAIDEGKAVTESCRAQDPPVLEMNNLYKEIFNGK